MTDMVSAFIEISVETKKKIEALTPENFKEAEDLINWMAAHVDEIAGLANGTHKIVPIADYDFSLCKAKADAFREAAKIVAGVRYPGTTDGYLNSLIEIESAAQKLDPTT